MDGPRPLERLWWELRDKILAAHPRVNADMLEVMRGTFYAGACAATHALVTDPALDPATLHAELEDFSRGRA